MEHLHRAIITFILSLATHQIPRHPFESPLVSFAAMFAIARGTGAWAEARNYSSTLGGLVWAVQVLLFSDAVRAAGDRPATILLKLRERRERTLDVGGQSAMSQVLR